MPPVSALSPGPKKAKVADLRSMEVDGEVSDSSIPPLPADVGTPERAELGVASTFLPLPAGGSTQGPTGTPITMEAMTQLFESKFQPLSSKIGEFGAELNAFKIDVNKEVGSLKNVTKGLESNVEKVTSKVLEVEGNVNLLMTGAIGDPALAKKVTDLEAAVKSLSLSPANSHSPSTGSNRGSIGAL